jgi:hypothetical protein
MRRPVQAGPVPDERTTSGRRLVHQRLLSVLFAAFLVLKLSLDRWPLTDVSMFRDRKPADVVPKRARFYGTRDGATFELSNRDFWLSEDEFNTRLRDEDDLARACGALAQSYNRRLVRRGLSHQQLTGAYTEREEIPRPGIAREPWHIHAECAVAADAP